MINLITVNLPLIYALPAILGLILLALALGVGAAVKSGTFDVGKLPQFLQTQVLTYYLPIVLLVALAQVNWAYFGTDLGITTAGFISASWAAISFYLFKVLLVNIKENLFIIFGITITVTETKGSVRIWALVILTVLMVATVIVFYLIC